MQTAQTAASSSSIFLTALYFFILFLILSSAGCRSGELTREQAADAIVSANSAGNRGEFIYLSLSEGGEPVKSWRRDVTGTDDTPEKAHERALASYADALPAFDLSQRLGLIEADFEVQEKTVPQKSLFTDWIWHIKTNFRLTDKGKKLFADYNLQIAENQFPVARRSITPIVTGMTKQGENQMLVEYEYKYEPNELGKYLDPQSAEYKSLPEDVRNSLNGTGRDGRPHLSVVMPQLSQPQKDQALFRKYDDGSWRIVR